MDNVQIGKNLAQARGKMSQAELAQKMNGKDFKKWSQATVWSTEKGERPLRLNEAQAICEILGISFHRLLDEPINSNLEQVVISDLGDLNKARSRFVSATADLINSQEEFWFNDSKYSEAELKELNQIRKQHLKEFEQSSIWDCLTQVVAELYEDRYGWEALAAVDLFEEVRGFTGVRPISNDHPLIHLAHYVPLSEQLELIKKVAEDYENQTGNSFGLPETDSEIIDLVQEKRLTKHDGE